MSGRERIVLFYDNGVQEEPLPDKDYYSCWEARLDRQPEVLHRGGVYYLDSASFFQRLARLANAPADHLPFDIEIDEQGRELLGRYFQAAMATVKRAVLYCGSRGVPVYLRGSELDVFLLEDPAVIFTTRDKISAEPVDFLLDHPYFGIPQQRFSRDRIRSAYPGQGGIDFKTGSTDPGFLRELFDFLQAKPELVEGEVDINFPNRYPLLPKESETLARLDPKIRVKLGLYTIPEAEHLQIINYQLQIGRPVVARDDRLGLGTEHDLILEEHMIASVNINLDTPNDRRVQDRCFNIDGLRARVVPRMKDGSRVNSVGAERMDPEKIDLHVILPEVPAEVILPDTAYEYYKRGIIAGETCAIEGFVEVVARAIRKKGFFGLEFAQDTEEKVNELIEMVRDCWFLTAHNETFIDKTSNELLVAAEVNYRSVLRVLVDTGLYKLLADQGARISLPDKLSEIETAVREIVNRLGEACFLVPSSLITCAAINQVICPDRKNMPWIHCERMLQLGDRANGNLMAVSCC